MHLAVVVVLSAPQSISEARKDVASDAVVAHARASQCAGVNWSETPFPCFSRGTHVFHLHIAKMAGREVMSKGRAKVGRSFCDWYLPYLGGLRSYLNNAGRTIATDVARVPSDALRKNFWGQTAQFRRDVMEHHAERPCFTSYEAGWPLAWAFRPAAAAVVTVLREPTSWVLSAVSHKTEQGCYQGLDDAYSRGCFDKPVSALCRCDDPKVESYAFAQLAVGLLDASINNTQIVHGSRMETGTGAGPAGVNSSLWRAAAHLEASAVGLVEALDATWCMWEFQFGLWFDRSSNHSDLRGAVSDGIRQRCDCRLQQDPRKRRRITDGVGQVHNYFGAPIDPKTMRAVAEQMSEHAQLYAFAQSLFMRRAAHVWHLTGVQLLCY